MNHIELIGLKEDIDRLETFLQENNGSKWFNFFTGPEPDDNEDWYADNIERWGCKWNCDAHDWERVDETKIKFSFESPWSPPQMLYEKIDNGDFGTHWVVIADWHEPGLRYLGQFYRGSIYEYEYDTTEESLNDIPEDIIDLWNLRDLISEY